MATALLSDSWSKGSGTNSDLTDAGKFTLYYSVSGNTISFHCTLTGVNCSHYGAYKNGVTSVIIKNNEGTNIAAWTGQEQLGYSNGSPTNKGSYFPSTKTVYLSDANLLTEGQTIKLYIGSYGAGSPYWTDHSSSYNLTAPEEMYEETTFALTLNKDSGFSATTGGGSYEEGTTVSINATIKSGYTWSKWTGNTDYLSSDATTQSNSITMPAAAVSLTATSTANIYKVTWDGNGGTSSVASNNVTFNSTYTLPTATRAGHTFDGWYTAASDGTQITSNTKHTTAGDITYYAQWTPWTFTVSYDVNGGEGSMSNSSHTYATASTLSECTFKKAGYSFLGWNTKADGSGNQYADMDDALKMATNESIANGGSITLYAQWGIKGIKFYFNGEWVVGRVKIYYNGAWY